MQAIPDADGAQLHATEGKISQQVGRGVGFAEIGSYAGVPAGEVSFELRPRGGGDALATARERLRNRAHYTVVAMAGQDERLMVLREGGAQGGSSRVRVVHAAPELGRVDVRLGEQPVADAARFGDIADYTTVEPGAYALRVTSPEDGSTIAARGAVTLTAGTSSTAFVVGSAGEPVQAVVAADRTAAPRGAPATGLGGLADEDSRVLVAALVGLLAALAGGAGYLALTARSRRGGP